MTSTNNKFDATQYRIVNKKYNCVGVIFKDFDRMMNTSIRIQKERIIFPRNDFDSTYFGKNQ